MQNKFKKPLFLFAFSPILITPLFITTSCSNNGVKNVNVTYDKKTDVTEFFSSHNLTTNAWTVDPQAFIISHPDWNKYFTTSGSINIENSDDISDFMKSLDWHPTDSGFDHNPFNDYGGNLSSELNQVYVCPYENNQATGDQFWYIYVSFNDNSHFSSQSDRFMIKWNLNITGTGTKSYILKSHSDDSHPWNYGANNSYAMDLEQSTGIYSQEDNVNINAFCNKIATGDESDPYTGGNGNEITDGWGMTKVEMKTGSDVDGTETFVPIPDLVVGGSALVTDAFNGNGKKLIVNPFTQAQLETAMNPVSTDWKLSNNTNKIRVTYASNVTDGFSLSLDFNILGSDDKNPSNFNNWNTEPTSTKNFNRKEFLQVSKDWNKPTDKANSKLMLEFFNKNIDGNFIIRNLLNQMMDASRDNLQYNRVKVTCDRIEIKKNGKDGQGFILHSFKIKNLKAELCYRNPMSGVETGFSSYTINTNKEVSVVAASLISSSVLPRLFNSETTMEDPNIASLNYKLPVLCYGSLTGGGAIDTLHPVQNNDLFSIDYKNNTSTISYSTNTFWSVIPAYSCYRDPVDCTSNINYCFPDAAGFPQIL